MKISPKKVLKLISYWPPYFFSGIKVLHVSEDITTVKVGLKVHAYNKNYFGTHFGGSLYSMCDPFYVFILANRLGKEHIIWDISSEIKFKKAVSVPVHATFEVTTQQMEEIAKQALENFKVEPEFKTNVVDDEGNIIAEVTKKLYVRRKDAKERFKEQSPQHQKS